MATSSDFTWNNINELRSIGDALVRISRKLHAHAHRLEIAVEGVYASDTSDPRVRLLNEALNTSRSADLELGRINQAMQRAVLLLQGQSTGPSQSLPPTTIDREREALATSITNLKREGTELRTLYTIAQTLNSTLEFDDVLRLVMDRVIEVVKAERGFLVLKNAATGALEFTIARDKDARTIPSSAFNFSRSTVGRVIQTREPVLTDDAQIDKALMAQESIVTYGIRSIMCAPLIVRNNCIGAVYVDSRINANLFGPKDLELLQAFCNQAAIAMDNARLFTQINKDKQYMDNIFASIDNAVITTDALGIIKTFNKAAGEILKLDPKMAVEKHFEEVFRERPQLGLTELLRDAITQQVHTTIMPRSVECEIPERGLVSLIFYVSPLRDVSSRRNGNGEYIGTAVVIGDRTEQKRAEAQAKMVRRIFERYVHPNVVQELIKNPKALNLGGETKEISVIFADIRGYTRLSETMAPEEVMNLVNRYHKIMCEALWEEEGTLTAFIGDALMAIFNAPLAQKNHALRAVRAAWKMRMAVQQYQRSQPQEMQVSFGFGVNTGLATVGNVGSQERLQSYTAMGDTVNVASRLQTNVTDNKILLNETTFLQVYRHIQYEGPISVVVKNKAAPLKSYYLLGVEGLPTV
jgi:adenylate cyclase